MSRFATVISIGASLHAVHVSPPPNQRGHESHVVRHVAHPRALVFYTSPDRRAADLVEQRLELERQLARAEDRRFEAMEHHRSIGGQTLKGPSGPTTFSGLAVGNPLAGTDAQTCALGNGSTIQVSGELRGAACQN